MSRTGISIKVTNTVLGSVPQVNANSMLVVVGATATNPAANSGKLAFTLDTPFMLRSVDDLATYDIDVEADNDPNAALIKEVQDFYAPVGGVNNTGTILWIVGTATDANVATKLPQWLRETVQNGFQYRPRNLITLFTANSTIKPAAMQKVIDQMYVEGFSTVMIMSGADLTANVTVTTPTSIATENAGMVGVVIITDDPSSESRPCVGKVGGYMASLSVGTSIGDVSLTSMGTDLYFIDPNRTPCSDISLNTANALGEAQYIFARTRPPKNGLWFNDGATANDDTTALSTLEAGRTIASMVDDLRAFFTPFINSKVPCSASGDISPTYKAVVLGNARSQIITPYIQSGDISDAEIDLKAVNDDMVGTRTWEVTLSILPAPTLRWIDGYVFYVKSL